MVTLANTQNYNEFELHARAILKIPVPEIKLFQNGASAVVLSDIECYDFPQISGLEKAALIKNTDFKIFGKPSARKYRRMAVALSYGSDSVEDLVIRAKKVASCITLN